MNTLVDKYVIHFNAEASTTVQVWYAFVFVFVVLRYCCLLHLSHNIARQHIAYRQRAFYETYLQLVVVTSGRHTGYRGYFTFRNFTNAIE